MTPLVSIIMPSYNAERYIAQSIESVMAQTYQNWELLITDDGSSDKTVAIVKEYCAKDERINLLESNVHHGPGDTRNMSINRAKGQFIAFIDNDDVWLPEKLEKQIPFMLENGYGFTYTAYDMVDEKGVWKRTVRTAGMLDAQKYMRNTVIGCATVVLNHDVVGEFQMFVNDTSDDMTLWLSLMHRGFNAYPYPEVLMRYRVRKHSASSNKLRTAIDVWKVYRRIEKLPWPKAAVNFICYSFNAVKKHFL